jgi:mRNA-degrading endonuclease RelE of RelBE toxin-antitoxin system
MNKIDKLLQKLNPKQRLQINLVLQKLFAGLEKELDSKKLKGTPDLFRVRAGSYRIIYRKTGNSIELLAVVKRDDRTYKDF